jgi:hypothetical protein
VPWVTYFNKGKGFTTSEESETVMNHSMRSADGRTHLKVVAVGFLCAFFVSTVGLYAHVGQVDLGPASPLKAGGPRIVSGQLPAIR